jgi:hypothetical protein
VEVSFEGIVIEESLEDKSVLRRMQVLSTSVEPVTEEHRTPWLEQWTLHSVRVADAEAGEVAEELSLALDATHANSWYADFKDATHHYVIFRDRVFLIDRRSREQYEAARRFGIERGLPEPQADFVALLDE